MTYQFRALAQEAAARAAVTPAEILALRQSGWADGRIDPAEADVLFALNTALAVRTAEWTDFFVEAISEFLLAGASPRGFIGDDQADWLIARIDRSPATEVTGIETMAELELLARLFDKAERLPARLKAYALGAIERVVLTGEGPTRDGGTVSPGCITSAEVRLLRRFIFSFNSATPGGVSREEAEMLFRIKDATLGADNAAEWPDLFVKGVANHLMGHNRFAELGEDRARQLESLMADTSPNVSRFFGRMVGVGAGAGLGAAADTTARALGFGRKGQARDLSAESADDARITELEDAWLQAQVDGNHQLDALDKALLRFIAAAERSAG